MGKEITVRQEQSPVSFLNTAIAKGLGVEQIEKLLELQAKYETMEAKKAYTAAMAEFKAVPLVITKDKTNSQYKSTYTTLGNLINTALPVMSKSGLSHKWDIQQGEKTITVTCVVTHSMGYSESTTMTAPPDTSGSKNAIQQLKSTITYLKSVTFESAMGLASSDWNMDDDGNSASIEYISKKQVGEITDLMNGNDVDEVKFLEWAKVDSIEHLVVKHYNKYISALQAKVEK